MPDIEMLLVTVVCAEIRMNVVPVYGHKPLIVMYQAEQTV